MTEIGLLLDMLTYRRPSDSVSERQFIDRFIVPTGVLRDVHGNFHLWVPKSDGTPSRMLWSCHYDTVHWTQGRQTLTYASNGLISLSRKAKRSGSSCLGADDTAGVFICLGMIKARVPGHYIFHYGEESGGQGSSAIAHDTPELLHGAEIAIAFDRRGSGDIITSQYGCMTASDTFAASLSMELSRLDPSLEYGAARGVYTDTAEYAGLIAECSNLSVGYQHEHTTHETLDSVHCLKLLHAMCGFDESAVVVDREPGEGNETWGWGYGSGVAVCQCGHTVSFCTCPPDTEPTEPLTDIDSPVEECPLCGYVVLDAFCEHCGWADDDDDPIGLHLDRDYDAIQRALRRVHDDHRLRFKGRTH